MDTSQPEMVALDRYNDPAYVREISEKLKDFVIFPVMEGSTFADGTPFRTAFSSDALRDCLIELLGDAIGDKAHALRLTGIPDTLFLVLPDADEALTQAYERALVAYAQDSPGYATWEGELQIWLVRIKERE
jgi:hypothetical protein